MSLPPILSNLPIFKIFTRSDSVKQNKAQVQNTEPRKNARDVVEISSEGLKKLSDIESRPAKASEAGSLASATRRILADDKNITLGLDPKFQE